MSNANPERWLSLPGNALIQTIVDWRRGPGVPGFTRIEVMLNRDLAGTGQILFFATGNRLEPTLTFVVLPTGREVRAAHWKLDVTFWEVFKQDSDLVWFFEFPDGASYEFQDSVVAYGPEAGTIDDTTVVSPFFTPGNLPLKAF